NRALVVSEKRTYKIVNDIPYPVLKSADEIIISNRAVGLNPIDWKSVEFNFCLPEFPWITGREVAGVVKAIGANVKELKVGDRVWASTYYRDRRAGCFQQYVAVPQHTVTRIPDNLDFESASCLGVAGLTAAMTLWKWLDVPIGSVSRLPAPSSIEYIVIWGGSTVTGQFAIQIAIQSGLHVIAVASEKTRPLVLSLGATRVVTRDGKTNDEIVSEIRTLGGDNITRAVDLVGAETAKFCLELFSTTKPGLFAPLAMISSDTYIPENIKVKSVEMKQFILNPESKIYATELNRLVSDGLVIMPTIEVLNGGLDSIESGLERLKRSDM
ncbi:chaperonin 10-like protein, partial [Talaromyces proteolyticus]